MSYKLAIADTVSVPVKFVQTDGAKLKNFSFTLFMERQTQQEFEHGCKGEHGLPSDEKIREQMLTLTTGWKDQTYVVDEDGQPADFCKEALEVMFSSPGVLDVVIKSYVKENGARAKN